VSEMQVRRLVYSDLPAVLSIERRAFETPWSLAMFVLELSKPSGICLALTDGDRLSGYLVCSRYADVWHLMNIAVVPERRRQGIARRLLERYRDRLVSAHVKDIAPSGGNLDEDGWADVGQGTLDWPRLWREALARGARWMVLEHDKPSDAVRFARVSRTFLLEHCA